MESNCWLSGRLGTGQGGGFLIQTQGQGTGLPIDFSYGWPLSTDDWGAKKMYFTSRGYERVARYRRGRHRSSPSWDGDEMDTCVDVPLAVVDQLDPKEDVLVGHSTVAGKAWCAGLQLHATAPKPSRRPTSPMIFSESMRRRSSSRAMAIKRSPPARWG